VRRIQHDAGRNDEQVRCCKVVNGAAIASD
jgi:hypothetical protein